MKRWSMVMAGVLAGLSAPVSAAPPGAAAIIVLARQAMGRTGAKGLAIAVIDHGRVASVEAFGARNARADRLTDDIIMYGASLTRTAFTFVVMQLVDDGKLDLGAEMKRRLFEPLGMANSDLKWRPAFATNLADGWTADGRVEPHDERSRVRAAGSMDTSISDMAKFAAALVRGERLSAAARVELVRRQLPITSRAQFPTLLPEALPARRRPSAGQGWRRDSAW